MTTPSQSLTLHTLTSSASDSQINMILSLATQIFSSLTPPNTNPDPHTSLPHWRAHLSHPSAHILYITPTTDPNNALGFVFNFPKKHEELDQETLHIWLAGVTEEARGQGIFALLVEETIRKARLAGFEFVTVATLPERFGRMFALLTASGWEEVAWRDTEAGRKVVMKIRVGGNDGVQ